MVLEASVPNEILKQNVLNCSQSRESILFTFLSSGNALHINGFGTHAIINGGNFLGGTGTIDDGLSLYVLNSAEVHIRAGTFRGEMKVERRGRIVFYGCFRKENTHITGVFEDGSELDVIVRSYYGDKVVLVPVSG